MSLTEGFSWGMAIFLVLAGVMMLIVLKDWEDYNGQKIRQELERQGLKVVTVRHLLYDDTEMSAWEYAFLKSYRRMIYYVEYLDTEGNLRAKNAFPSENASHIEWKDRPKM